MSQATDVAPTVISEQSVLREIAQRVLWLSTAIVDAANRGRPNATGVKVGGHQASSASMVDMMVALWFHELTAHDRVSVKPHASPVLHAINYLLEDLDQSYLTMLRTVLPHHAANEGWSPVIPEPAEGSGHGRLLNGLGRNWRNSRALGSDGPPLLAVPF